MKYPASHLSPFPPSFPRRPSASHSIRAPRFLACPFADYVRKSFIYRFYAEFASKSFIYRIYVSAPGCGGLPVTFKFKGHPLPNLRRKEPCAKIATTRTDP